MNKKTESLCVVAHPDDETIWMGGTILQNPYWNWTILSLSRKDDTNRAPKFKKVCELYKATPIISDLDDEILGPLSIKQIIKKIEMNLPKKKFDYVYTHGENGEYGHIRHKEIHEAVKQMISEKRLVCEKLLFFSYVLGKVRLSKKSELAIPTANPKSDIRVFLNDDSLSKKINLVTSVYGFKSDSFEALSCGSRETFDVGTK